MAQYTAPEPFTINVPDAVLTDLRERLDRVRWPGEVPDTGWDYGVNLAYLKELVEYWRTQYDWRVHEGRLNAFQQFTVPLSEIEVHFIHQPGVGPAPLPLLLLHGWRVFL
jgi:microsomal epoxide hydrolase